MAIIDINAVTAIPSDNHCHRRNAGSDFDTMLKNIDVVSFDFFDTLVERRTFFSPKDLFLLIKYKVREESGLYVEDFEKQRVRAENIARRYAWAKNHEDVTFEEIYQQLARIAHLSKAEATVLAATELACEYENLTRCQAGWIWFEAAAAAGKKIIIVSDTYFSADVIRDMAEKQNYKHFSEIFSSANWRSTKASGRLFEQVLNRIACHAGKILHIGDNRHSDGCVPVRYGIQTQVISSAVSSFRARHSIGDKSVGNIVLARMISDLCQLQVLPETASDEQVLARLGTECLSILYLSFAIWIARQLQDRQHKKVYFGSRDGWIIKKVFDLVCKTANLSIETHYLYLSRSVLYPTLFFSAPEQAAQLYGKSWEKLTLRQAIQRLGLNYGEVKADLHRYGLYDPRLDVRDHKHQFIQFIDGLRDEIKIRFAAQYRHITDYFIQEGILDDQPFAFVDIGWHGSLQNCLVRLRQSHGIIAPTDGYYLATMVPENNDSKISSMTGFLADRCQPDRNTQLVRFAPSLIELMHSAPHGSVIGYSRKKHRIRPELENASLEIDQYHKTISIAQKAALSFIESHLVNIDNPLQLLETPDHEVIAPVALRFIESPSFSEAKILGRLLFSSDFGTTLKSLTGIGEHDPAAIKNYILPDGRWSLWSKGLNTLLMDYGVSKR